MPARIRLSVFADRPLSVWSVPASARLAEILERLDAELLVDHA